MSSWSKGLLAAVLAFGLSSPTFAQPKADAGSGPTSGTTSTNDAGSGSTQGVKPSTSAANDSTGSTENSAGVTPGAKSTGGSQPVTPAMPEKK
jgi:hypothetical protein